MAKEFFSWLKFISGFTTGVGWTKAIAIGIRILLLVGIILGPYLGYKYVYNKGYNKGQIEMAAKKDAEFKKWIAEHPLIQAGDNCTVNTNVREKQDHFQFRIVPLTIGWCE